MSDDAGGTSLGQAALREAWRLTATAPLRTDHNVCALQVANRRAAVDRAREACLVPECAEQAQRDLVLLLHNLIGTLLGHADCNSGYVAEALSYADKAVDLQARQLVRAVEAGVEARVVADIRGILADECELRAEVRRVAGFELNW